MYRTETTALKAESAESVKQWRDKNNVRLPSETFSSISLLSPFGVNRR